MQGTRIWVIAVVFVLVLGGSLGGQHFYHQYRQAPLSASLEETAGVTDVRLVSKGGRTDVMVSIANDVELPQVYAELEAAAHAQLGGRLGRIELQDTRDERLNQAFYDLHFAIQEAISTGAFTRLAEETDAVAARHGVDRYRTFVDLERVYVQLHARGRALYEIIPRSASSEPDRWGVQQG